MPENGSYCIINILNGTSRPVRVEAHLALGMSSGHVPSHPDLFPCERLLFLPCTPERYG